LLVQINLIGFALAHDAMNGDDCNDWVVEDTEASVDDRVVK